MSMRGGAPLSRVNFYNGRGAVDMRESAARAVRNLACQLLPYLAGAHYGRPATPLLSGSALRLSNTNLCLRKNNLDHIHGEGWVKPPPPMVSNIHVNACARTNRIFGLGTAALSEPLRIPLISLPLVPPPRYRGFAGTLGRRGALSGQRL